MGESATFYTGNSMLAETIIAIATDPVYRKTNDAVFVERDIEERIDKLLGATIK